jgi:hypothetical protein
MVRSCMESVWPGLMVRVLAIAVAPEVLAQDAPPVPVDTTTAPAQGARRFRRLRQLPRLSSAPGCFC